MSRIYFVRHGESESNLANTINDDPARRVKLTEAGRLQCLARAKDFQSLPLTHAFSSEFPRAQETMRILLQAHPHVVQRVDARLNEWRTGMDGKTLDYLHRQIDLGVRLPETFDDVVMRLEDFIHDMKKLGKDSCILVVSHKITILAGLVATGKIQSEEARHMAVRNCEMFSVSLDVS